MVRAVQSQLGVLTNAKRRTSRDPRVNGVLGLAPPLRRVAEASPGEDPCASYERA